jgi:hypothetical protein
MVESFEMETKPYRWLTSPVTTLRLYSAEPLRGTLSDCQLSEAWDFVDMGFRGQTWDFVDRDFVDRRK